MALQTPLVRVIVFDAYGTLLDIHSPATSLSSELGERAAAVSALWRAKQVEYTWLRSLMGDYAPFDQVTADALNYALAAHGLADGHLREKLLALYRTLKPYDDAAGALAALKQASYPTAILSNGSPGMLADAIAASGLGDHLDKVLSVDAVGIYKPSPRVYRLAIDAFGLEQPAEVAFISANGWDCAGAACFGFQVIHINRFGQPPERLPHKPVAEIGSLSELVGLLLPRQ